MRLSSALRLLGAGMIVVGGAVHYDLWSGGYRGIPSIGPLFLLNVGASALVAGLLLLTGRGIVLIAGSLFSMASLAALVASRTVGLLGFVEGWTDASIQVLAAEVGALVALAASAATRRRAAPVAVGAGADAVLVDEHRPFTDRRPASRVLA